MSKKVLMLSIIVGLLVVSQSVYAEKSHEMKKDMPMMQHQHGGEMGMDMPMEKGQSEKMGMPMMAGKEKMMDHQRMGGVMMMKSMMPSGIVSVENGGFVVLAGNKLLKYDNNLELVKEAKVPMDMGGMQEMMQNMKNSCPMCQGMMGDESKE